jgi:hypothetical protein
VGEGLAGVWGFPSPKNRSGRFEPYSGTRLVLALVDFLNSREDAILVWTIALIAFVVWKGGEDFWASIAAFVRAAAAPKLLVLFGSAAAYCAAVVFAAERAGLWHSVTLKETVYWFVGSGIVLVGNATHASPGDARYFRKVLRNAVSVTIAIAFIVNVYVFPLAVELILVPIVLLLVGMQVIVENDAKYIALRRAIDRLLVAIGLFVLAYFAIRAITDLDGLLTRERVEALLVAPALTLAFIPFLLAVAWVSRREQERLRKRFRVRLESPTA